MTITLKFMQVYSNNFCYTVLTVNQKHFIPRMVNINIKSGFSEIARNRNETRDHRVHSDIELLFWEGVVNHHLFNLWEV